MTVPGPDAERILRKGFQIKPAEERWAHGTHVFP